MTAPALPLAASLLVPFAAAAALWLLRMRPEARRAVSLGAAAAQVGLAAALLARALTGGAVVETMGGWPAPFGITLVADALSAGMLLAASLVGGLVLVFALADVTEAEERRGFSALAHALLGGTAGAFLTGDLFNLYVWFEVTLIAAFGLMALRGGAELREAAIRYAAMNLVATIAMLLGVGMLYGATGALNMAELAVALEGRSGEAAVLAPAGLLFFAFAAKAGFFPLFFWLPESYHAPSQSVTALFSALLTKMAVYALYRVFTLIFEIRETPGLQALLLATALATMVIGALGAASQYGVRKILAFHIVSQIGYMGLGLALATPLGLAAGLFHLVHNMLAKTNLFLTGAIAARLAGSEELSRMGGMWAARPGLSLLYLVSALAMAGIPPLSGFWAKFFILHESFSQGWWLAGAIALATGLLTLYSMTKIWAEAFWKPHPDPDWRPAPAPAAMVAPALALVGLIALAGIAVGPAHGLALEAAGALIDRDGYIEAVLGPRPERMAGEMP
ncbi:proton-conducting transporter transmembrane domain-containing protein [Rubrimonas sp.]|uniref:proton-conducting transporter transmembrane domain-containing protein n=1 Tax=Rubrimonas sp. TaxID=2036015 RepID=UPI002FDED9B5